MTTTPTPTPAPTPPTIPGGPAASLRRILLVRHAECEMNLRLDTRIGGRSNGSPLTPLGVAQARALGARLARAITPAPASIHSSTAVRAAETAAACATAAGLPLSSITTSDALLELDMGDWEGADRAACYGGPGVLDAIRADPTGWAAPGGESQAAVEARMAAYLETAVLPTVAPGGPPALVVGHGLAIKCLLRRVLAADPARFAARNVRLDNTALVEIALCGSVAASPWPGWDAVPRDAWHVLRVNDAGHCEGLDGSGGQEERLGA